MLATKARKVDSFGASVVPVAVALALAAGASIAARAESSASTLTQVLSRMAEARAQNQARLRSYVVTRTYTLYGKDEQHRRTEVIADISFQPPGSKQYEIVRTEGSGVGERIVRRMLDGETKIVKDYAATDISPANYDFQLIGVDESLGVRCYLLSLTPKRTEKTLLRGNVWVDANTYLLRRIEAAPGKSPSWWLRDVELVFSYEDVEGLWLQTASQFTTNVRFFGRHTMKSHDSRYVFDNLNPPDAERSNPRPSAFGEDYRR